MSALVGTVIPVLCISIFGPSIKSENVNAEAIEKVEDTIQTNHWVIKG